METAAIKVILREVCHEIGGEWLMVGGALINLEYDEYHPVRNIHIVHLSHPTLSVYEAEHALMTAAARLKFDPEVVVVDPLDSLDTFPGWTDEVREWRRGKIGGVAKPSLTLLVAMKLKRGNTEDIEEIKLALLKEGRSEFNERSFRRLTNSHIQAKFDGYRARLGL